MSKNFEVSFNSPQCGWMSVGFEHDGSEFHTTTAHAPHENALSELLTTIAEMLSADGDYRKRLKWNRDPEEYDFVFSKNGPSASLEIVEYPTAERENGERVYKFVGDASAMAGAFVTTFQQLHDERDVDEFEANWHQKFPFEEFEKLKKAVGVNG